MIQDNTRLQIALGHMFSDSSLLEEALTHRSVGGQNYERLEFLGDAILGMLVAEDLYTRFPAASEGQMSRMRASVVRGDTLAEIARDLSLGDYIVLGPGELKSGGHRRSSILADTLEAVLGAIYLDSNLDECRKFLVRHFAKHLSRVSPSTISKDPKTRLQEYLQARQLDLPDYTVLAVDGVAHNQSFTVQCSISGMEPATSTAGSRRKAEQAAAQIILENLEK